MATIEIRPLKALDEMRPVVDLQKVYWGDDLESVIPAHMLFSLANHGGHVLGAFDGDTPVGMLVGFLSTNMKDPNRPAMANLQIFSKRMVVLPDYRGQGIGYRLKLAQREIAKTQGVRLVVWTFDPMLALNAHLNIRKLGAVCNAYYENYYGTSSEGGLTSFGMSDRLMAEWWVTNRRVEERISGTRKDLTLAHYLDANTPIINPSSLSDDGILLTADSIGNPEGSLGLLEIPTRYTALEASNPRLAQSWRLHVRQAFKQIISRGFIVTDFITEAYEKRERSFYLLTYNGAQYESFNMN
ncbi:MAG: GNAT family N-acetyltransferase [Chloroflexota bacterium]